MASKKQLMAQIEELQAHICILEDLIAQLADKGIELVKLAERLRRIK